MGWLAKLLGRTTGAPVKPPEHAVIVRFQYGSTDLTRLFELEGRLTAAVAAKRAGEYDGNEVAVDGSDGVLYLYGPDADRLYEAIRPVLEATPFMKAATATKRYGPPQDGVRSVTVTIGT